jgi:glycosyltransferase involved in cell wall biosynthesis
MEQLMVNPLISVIIPVFNNDKFVGRTIQSLIDQTYENWELIIIDDGSTDGTENVIKSFGDSRISYSYQNNLGVKRLAQTINNGLVKTKGELVTMLPSDDTWINNKLEKQVSIFEDPKVVLCFGKMNLIDENDKIIGYSKRPQQLGKIKNNTLGEILREMLVSNFIPQPTVLIRKSALTAIGGYLQPEGLFAEDYPTQLALALIGEFRYLDIPLANYRMHGNQMTRNHQLNMVKTDVQYVLEFFKSLDPKIQAITAWNAETLKRRLDKRLYSTYFQVGRFELLKKNWTEARRNFVTAIMRGDLESKAKSIPGFLFSFFHLNIEIFAKLSKRVAPLK